MSTKTEEQTETDFAYEVRDALDWAGLFRKRFWIQRELTPEHFIKRRYVIIVDRSTHMILVPVFSISYEAQERMGGVKDFEVFSTKIFDRGGIVVRHFNTRSYTVYLPSKESIKMLPPNLESTTGIPFGDAEDMSATFGSFCMGIINAGGYIVPDVTTKNIQFYMPVEVEP